MILCKYKDIFGKPKKGIHSVRIFGLAAVDTIGTIIIAYLLSRYMKWNPWYTILSAFVIGELLHYLFCVDTAFLKLIQNK